MANILCIYENIIATVSGTREFLIQLSNERNEISVRFQSVSKIKKSDIDWCDILYMIRPNNMIFGRISRLAKKSGIMTITVLDDHLLILPKGIPDMPWRKKGLIFSSKNTDILVSSNSYILQEYAKNFDIPRTVLLNTAVPDYDIKQHHDNGNGEIRIVYAAGIGHKKVFEDMIKPILKKLDETYGSQISLSFMGVHPDLDPKNYKMKMFFIEPMPLIEYRLRIEKENFDIGLAPLVTNEFTKCKYFNKFIEYSMFGIVGLYSKTEPYTFVVNDKENGILVDNTPSNWLEAIESIITNKDLIEKCRKNAYETLRKRFNLKNIVIDYTKSIPELLYEHEKHSINSFQLCLYQIMYFFSRVGDLIYKIGYLFKQGGIKEVSNGIKRKINSVSIAKKEF